MITKSYIVENDFITGMLIAKIEKSLGRFFRIVDFFEDATTVEIAMELKENQVAQLEELMAQYVQTENIKSNAFETDGCHNGIPIYCPVNNWNCPYCDKNNICRIIDPMEQCTDFASTFDNWEDWEALQ